MRKVRLDKAQTGVVVARAIHTLDGVVLLSSGVRLTREHKDKLLNYGITEIYIEDPTQREYQSLSLSGKRLLPR